MSKHAKHVAPKQKKTSASRAVNEPAPDWINETAAEEPARAKKKRSKNGLTIAVIVLAVIAVLLAAVYLVFSHFYSKLNYEAALTESERAGNLVNFELLEEEEELASDEMNASDQEITDMQSLIQDQLSRIGGSKMSDADVINVLLVGTDARSRDEAARSDVMMLASLNKKTHKLVLTSFMRDIYTYIPDYSTYNRLNTPYALGGAGSLIDTLEQDFGVEINNYAAVNFYDFANIIDAVGGVDIPLTNAEVDFINGQAYDGEQAYLGVGTGAIFLDYSSDGQYHLNGTQALAHCRNRSSSGSDYDRTDRQRTVIAAMLAKAKGLSLNELYSLLDVVLPMVTTDLTQADCLSLILSSAEYLSYQVESLRIPAADYYDTYINGMAVLSIDFASNAKILQDAIYQN